MDKAMFGGILLVSITSCNSKLTRTSCGSSPEISLEDWFLLWCHVLWLFPWNIIGGLILAMMSRLVALALKYHWRTDSCYDVTSCGSCPEISLEDWFLLWCHVLWLLPWNIIGGLILAMMSRLVALALKYHWRTDSCYDVTSCGSCPEISLEDWFLLWCHVLWPLPRNIIGGLILAMMSRLVALAPKYHWRTDSCYDVTSCGPCPEISLEYWFLLWCHVLWPLPWNIIGGLILGRWWVIIRLVPIMLACSPLVT